jgi:pimeloyl-ACP methyl ester carboxylesterase
MRARMARLLMPAFRMVVTAIVMMITLAAGVLRLAAQEHSTLERSREGSAGPQLLLIPCMSCRWRSFDSFMQRNRDRYRMVAVTLPGFGGTPVPGLPRNTAEPVWHRNAIHQLSLLIDEERLDSVVIVAHSFGADMALQLAAARPAVVHGLVLLDSWPFSDRSWFREERAAQLAQADSTIAQQSARFADPDEWQRFNTPSIPDPGRRLLYHGWFMATPMDVVLQYWRENSIDDLNPLWSRISVPVLDVKGISASSTDPAKERTDRLAQLRANGVPDRVQTVFLDSTGHFVHEVRPASIDSLIGRFVSRLRSTGPRPDGIPRHDNRPGCQIMRCVRRSTSAMRPPSQR